MPKNRGKLAQIIDKLAYLIIWLSAGLASQPALLLNDNAVKGIHINANKSQL